MTFPFAVLQMPDNVFFCTCLNGNGNDRKFPPMTDSMSQYEAKPR